MNLKKSVSLLLIITFCVVAVFGCKKNSSNSGEKEYKIGVIQYVQHEALDASHEGFFDALDDEGIKYTIDDQNASGETSSCQTIAETLVNNKNDLIFAIATPATQAVAGVTEDIPIVVTAVTDPYDAGLVEDNEKPDKNVTGTSDLTPVKEQIDLLTQVLPDATKVGILYCSAESNSVLQAQIAKNACKDAGLESVDFTISSTNEIQTVVESMVGKVDVIYTPTDNMVAAGMTTISQVATENKIPIICGEKAQVENGGLATYGINYYKLGYEAGLMAVDILKNGKNPKDMAIGYLDANDCELVINKSVADELGIDTSEVKDAKYID